jgi:hypothetical protein
LDGTVTPQLFLLFFCIGSALIGLWLVVRYPRLGPQRPLTVLLAVLVATLALQPAAAIFAVVADFGGLGPVLGLMLVVFPALTAAFWTAACALRTLGGASPRF